MQVKLLQELFFVSITETLYLKRPNYAGDT